MKTKLCDKAKWFLSGIVVGFTCPSLLYSTLLSDFGIPRRGILGRGCLNYGDAKITVTSPCSVHLKKNQCLLSVRKTLNASL